MGTLLSPTGFLFSEPRAPSAGTEPGAGTVAEGGLCAECTREEGVYTMVYRKDTHHGIQGGHPAMVYPGYTHPPCIPGLYTPNSDNPGYTHPTVITQAIPHPMYVPGLYRTLCTYPGSYTDQQ